MVQLNPHGNSSRCLQNRRRGRRRGVDVAGLATRANMQGFVDEAVTGAAVAAPAARAPITPFASSLVRGGGRGLLLAARVHEGLAARSARGAGLRRLHTERGHGEEVVVGASEVDRREELEAAERAVHRHVRVDRVAAGALPARQWLPDSVGEADPHAGGRAVAELGRGRGRASVAEGGAAQLVGVRGDVVAAARLLACGAGDEELSGHAHDVDTDPARAEARDGVEDVAAVAGAKAAVDGKHLASAVRRLQLQNAQGLLESRAKRWDALAESFALGDQPRVQLLLVPTSVAGELRDPLGLALS